MEICDFCKGKLVEFYHFRLRVEEVQLKILETDFNVDSLEEHLELDTDDKTVHTTLQIVKEFLSRHRFVEIKEDEKQLIIMSTPSSNQITQALKEADDVEDDASDSRQLEEVEIFKDEEVTPEYLEEIEELFPMSVPIKEEEQQFEAEELLTELEESDDSFDNQQNSESASDLKKPSNPRRPRKPDTWACNKRKSLRNSGQTYLNSKGKLVDAKQMRESCGEWCRSKCITKISEQDRQEAFDYYWGLGDVVKQRKWIYEHITSAEPKRRRSEVSNRTITLQFYLDAKDDEVYQSVQVCKKMFKNTLVISSQVIQGVVKKYSLEGFHDSRGKFKRKLTVSQQIAAEHVKKFPFFYIEQTMTKVQCYQMYCQECFEQGIEPVKEGNYRDIFDRQNQGNFLKTEKITCETCHRYYKATDEERLLLQRDHENHISLGVNKKCRDRALGRLRHKRAQERKKLQKLAAQEAQNFSTESFPK